MQSSGRTFGGNVRYHAAVLPQQGVLFVCWQLVVSAAHPAGGEPPVIKGEAQLVWRVSDYADAHVCWIRPGDRQYLRRMT